MTTLAPTTLRFTVEGRPVPAARMTRAMARERNQTPQIRRYLDYRAQVGWTAKQAGVTEPLSGRLYVRLWVYLAKRGRLDAENVSKAVCDGLNGVAWHDDSQIDDLRVLIYSGRPTEFVDIEIGAMAPPHLHHLEWTHP